MLMKFVTNIIIDVKDAGEAEEAGYAIDASLESVMNRGGFPHGTVIDASVDDATEVSAQEAKEQGWDEE